MSSLIRKHQQPLMIILTILTIIIFVGYWNGPTGNRNRMPVTSDAVAKIYGNTLTRTTLQHEGSKAQLARALQLDLFGSLAGQARTLEEAVDNFAWNSLVMQHEADRLQLEPMGQAVHTDVTVMDAIKNLPSFQTIDGHFDPKAYNDFINGDFLHSLGFTGNDLEEVVAEDLRMKKIKALLQTTFVVDPAEFRAYYTRTYQKMDVSVIHFTLADFTAKIQPSDEDIRKTFEQHTEGYTSEEMRGIKFVTFALSDAEAKLTGKDRIAALQKLSDSAGDFTQALQEKGAVFDDVAAKFKAPLTVVPPFSASAPDPKVPKFANFLETVFTLTKEAPISDPVQDQETGAYYVVQLQDIVPKKRLTLAEARPQVIEEIKDSRGQEQMTEQAREARNKIADAMKAGKSFADAAKAGGWKVEAYPPFSPEDPDDLKKKDDAEQVYSTAYDMKEGDLSEFVQTMAGGILVHMDKREPIDPKQFETDRARLEPIYDEQKVNLVFAEWLRKQHQAADIRLLGRNNATPVPTPPK